MATPTRSCVSCRRRRDQRQLVRLVVQDGAIRVDPFARLPGRGAYVCDQAECFTRVTRREGAGLRRALRTEPGTRVDVEELGAAWAANKR